MKRLLSHLKKNNEEIISRNSTTKKWSEVIGSYSPGKKIVKRLLVGTVPPKDSEEIIGRYSPTKKNSEEVIGRNSPTEKELRGNW